MKKVEYYIVITLYNILKRIPLALGNILSIVLAFIIKDVFRYRRNTVLQNLNIAFPEYSEKQIKLMFKNVYYHFASLWIEFLQNWRVNEKYIDKNFKVFNWHLMEEAIAQKKGVILLTGHIGNIEWLGQFMSIKLPEIYAIGKKISNPYIHDFVEKSRTQNGAILLYTKNIFDKCLEVLKNKKVLAIAGDQDSRKKVVWVDFFGVPSATAQGAALFHLQTGAPIIFVTAIRKKWGKFDIQFERIDIPDTLKFTEENIFYITQKHIKILEKWIKIYPAQYFWTHRRWKSQPEEYDLKKYNFYIKNLDNIVVS